MATTYNWNCKTVDAYPQDGDYTDLVYNVHWDSNRRIRSIRSRR